MEPINYTDNNRKCLICGSSTSSCHMGIDVCRACTIFYRRTRNKTKDYTCKSGTGRCQIDRDEGLSCKKCRFDKFTSIIEESQSESFHPISNDQPSRVPYLYQETASSSHSSAPSTSSYIPSPTSTQPPPSEPNNEESMIMRIRQSYTLLSLVRRISELSTRKDPVHPTIAADGNIPFIPTTFQSLNQSARILVTAMFDYAASAFDEFGSLTTKDKWFLIKNYHPVFIFIEGTYRSTQLFPSTDSIILTGYTHFVDINNMDQFFVDIPNRDHVVDATNVLKKHFIDNFKICRDAVLRLKPTENEFLAMLGIAFWNIYSTPACDKLLQMGEKYRNRILHNLHSIYKDDGKHCEYAGRLGELFFLLMTFQNCASTIPEKFEIFRLLDIMQSDNLIYEIMNKK